MDPYIYKVLVLGELPEADTIFSCSPFNEEFPCEIERVEDPDEFADAVTKPEIDLILIDVDPHGIEVLEGILEQRPMRPLIMVAEAARGDDVLQAKRMGLERYVIRLDDESLNADLLAEEVLFTLKRLTEPPGMEHPTVEELFRFAQYHNVRQPFFVVDRNHRLLYSNGVGKTLVETVHGHPLRQGYRYKDFALGKTRQSSVAHLERALGGERVQVEHSYPQLPDDDRHRELLYQPVKDTSGKVVAVSIACKNIGRRRRAQDQLQRQEQAIWSFFDLVPLPLNTVGHDLVVGRANAALADLLGYGSGTELEGAEFGTFIHPEDVDRVRDALAEIFNDDEPYSRMECRYLREDGETMWVNHISFPLRGVGEAEEGPLVLILSADITRQKEAEERERQSQRLRAIGELAAGVAHDFNNVLSVVTTYSHLLEAKLDKNDGKDELSGFIDKILGAVDRAVALTRQLLTFGDDDQQSTTIVDLNHRIREMNALIERTIGEQIDVQIDLADELPEIEIDPSQLDQVFMNLVVNARDAMPEGGVLSIGTRCESIGQEQTPPHSDLHEGDYAILEVSDTGMGMDEKTQRHIFEPFFTTKGRAQGTGLGLATVFRVVERTGGHIYVDSDPDEGTTFTIYFPKPEKP